MKHLLIISAAVAALIAGSASAAQTPDVTAPAPAASSAKADLSLTFKVAKFQKGALMIAIFDSEAAYMNSAP